MYLFAYTRTQRKDVLSDNVVVFVDVIPYIPVDKSAVQTADKRARGPLCAYLYRVHGGHHATF
jgi:hypothetical protein